MSLLGFASLFAAMLVLALTPGPGIFSVVATTLYYGFRKGLWVVAGIICGDYVFILLVLNGLQAVASQLDELFVLLQYLGAAYLVWLGLTLMLHTTIQTNTAMPTARSGQSAFLTGLLVTLGNPKAIFFYLSFFPAFVDPQLLLATDIVVILILVTIALGSTMSMYAWLASRAGKMLLHKKHGKALNSLAGGILIASGATIALRA